MDDAFGNTFIIRNLNSTVYISLIMFVTARAADIRQVTRAIVDYLPVKPLRISNGLHFYCFNILIVQSCDRLNGVR